jgi:hypothetical protein
MFEPQGFFKHTKTLEYDSYCQGVEDVMELICAQQDVDYQFRDKVLSLIVEAADDFT